EIPTEDEFIEETPDEFQLINHLCRIDMDSSTLLHSIQDVNPDIARYMKIINSKVEALARHVVSLGLTDEVQSYKVTLSAGGLSLITSEAIELGKTVRTRMVLYPSCSGILTYGEVVRCNPIPNSEPPQFDTAIEYKLINETDRDALVKHVLQLQSNILRQRK
ncbi:MAG: PilZ domain-containing protein, partial [Gammaproteobacteria bacterium]|nr:PilZ domain-containing protein [Gammaproteobacteria bacterium]